MLLIAVVAFFLVGLLYLSLPDSWWKLVAILLAACLLAVLLAAILIYDRKRSRELISEIRKQMT
jgi:protein-S-isoprenylcysteine O-methyltransferase Ste14